MRFKQFLKEAVSNKEMNEWFRQYELEAFASGQPRRVYQDIYDNGIEENISELGIGVESGDITWKPLLQSDEWGNIVTFNFLKMVGRHTIKNFSDIPNVKNLSFNDCTIESLNGAEKLSEVQYIAIEAWCHFNGGLLKFLKMPNLREFHIGNFIGDNNLEQALAIVKKHVEDGENDIVSCQTDLMDANLEEFAKL